MNNNSSPAGACNDTILQPTLHRPAPHLAYDEMKPDPIWGEASHDLAPGHFKIACLSKRAGPTPERGD